MPFLSSFKIAIQTGDVGTDETVHYEFNSHKLELCDIEGGTAPGQRFEGTGEPRSFVHSLHLIGPEEGEWTVDSISVEFTCQYDDPYEIEYGPVVLTPNNMVQLWVEKPPPVYDV